LNELHSLKIFNDPKISLKAKGLVAYLLSKPINSVVTREEILKHCSDGSTSLSSAMKELRKAGYVEIAPVRGKKGKISVWNTKVVGANKLADEKLMPELEICIKETK
jgi:hypothetical protein